MQIKVIPLHGSTPGTQRSVSFLHYGQPGAHPKCYLQAGLHADETPGLLVMQHLRARLEALEAAGQILGEVVLVPTANPIGLSQIISGTHLGRFCLTDGTNFNRGFPALFAATARRIEAQLGPDVDSNQEVIWAALQAELQALPVTSEVQSLKHVLLAAALDADVMLDLHCDTEAVLHLYTGTPLIDRGLPLARLLGARALLTAEISGDDPFDEACSRPWWELARRFPQHPIPPGCFSATVELRGAADVDHRTAAADAAALIDFMVLRGAIVGTAPDLPALQCAITPLSGSQPMFAETSGVVVFHRNVGEYVNKGDLVADLVDPVSGDLVRLLAPTTGTLYARTASRWAYAGMRLAKIAGAEATRSGNLLSP